MSIGTKYAPGIGHRGECRIGCEDKFGLLGLAEKLGIELSAKTKLVVLFNQAHREMTHYAKQDAALSSKLYKKIGRGSKRGQRSKHR